MDSLRILIGFKLVAKPGIRKHIIYTNLEKKTWNDMSTY